jgi:nicotinamidase-related amidase
MKTCLLVIDAQESFRHRPYFVAERATPYLAAQNALIAGCQACGLPIVRVLHSDGPEQADNPFARSSGFVRPLEGLLAFKSTAEFVKSRHSALVGTGLDVWLVQHGIRRLIVSGIRTEQCCETTTRHASDLGWTVDFVAEATLTFDMQQADGSTLPADAIVQRTATVLQDRFATVCSVADALDHAMQQP